MTTLPPPRDRPVMVSFIFWLDVSPAHSSTTLLGWDRPRRMKFSRASTMLGGGEVQGGRGGRGSEDK